MKIQIDWLEDNSKQKIHEALNKLIENNDIEIYISNVISNNFIDEYDVEEPTDFKLKC